MKCALVCLALAALAVEQAAAMPFAFQVQHNGTVKIVPGSSSPDPVNSWAAQLARGPGGWEETSGGWGDAKYTEAKSKGGNSKVFSFLGGTTTTVSGSLSGSGSLTKTGTGTLAFSWDSSISVDMVVTEARLIGKTDSLQGNATFVGYDSVGNAQFSLENGAYLTIPTNSVLFRDSFGEGEILNLDDLSPDSVPPVNDPEGDESPVGGGTGNSSELEPKSAKISAASTPKTSAIAGFRIPQKVSEANPGANVFTDAPYSSIGLVRAHSGKATAAGSGVVAQDPRLLFTCAHLLYYKGRWAELVAFRRSWNSEYAPDDSPTVFARGFYYFSSYKANKKRLYDYDIDFAVAFAKAGETFGPAALGLNAGSGGDPDGLGNLTSKSTSKMILGYPFYFFDADANFKSAHLYMHQTGAFTGAGPNNDAFYPIFSTFYGINYVSSGPGHGGAPLLVQKDADWRVAGIVVNGAYDGTGIAVIDSYAKSVANAALAAAAADIPDTAGSSTFTAAAKLKKPLVLPDGGTKFTTLKIAFSRIPGWVTKVLLDLNITADKRGDLEVSVRSPAGRVYLVANPDPTVSGTDLVLNGHDISGAFSRSKPNGKWEVFVRDAATNGSRAQVNSAALQLTGL